MNSRRVYISSIILLLLAISIYGCERHNDADQRLMAELERRAMQESSQSTAVIGYVHQFSTPDIFENQRISARGNNGEYIEVTDFYLVTSAIELHYCEPPIIPALNRFKEYFIPAAYAHVPSSATRLGIPYVENLFGVENNARIVNSIAPPSGKYCAVHIILTPADDDVMNLTSLETSQIEGATAFIKGRWKTDADAAWQPFQWTSSKPYSIAIGLTDNDRQPDYIELTSAHDTLMVLITKQISNDLFQELSAQELVNGSAIDTVLDKLFASFALYD